MGMHWDPDARKGNDVSFAEIVKKEFFDAHPEIKDSGFYVNSDDGSIYAISISMFGKQKMYESSSEMAKMMAYLLSGESNDLGSSDETPDYFGAAESMIDKIIEETAIDEGIIKVGFSESDAVITLNFTEDGELEAGKTSIVILGKFPFNRMFTDEDMEAHIWID